MKAAVILSTYNSPDWLEKVLWGYSTQSVKDFRIVVADDGSDRRTADRIDFMREQTGLDISHVWHEDEGFRKTRILNLAIREAVEPYLIFSDGDCIPRSDFVRTHLGRATPGHFLSGGYFKLPLDISERLQQDDIISGRAFDWNWLRAQGHPATWKSLKLRLGRRGAALLNTLTPTGSTWNGHNASAYRQDILDVNGFDEEMAYGGEDRELGERMMNNGLRGVQIRYSAICIHLEHARGYVNEAALSKNAAIRRETKQLKRVWTDRGIIRAS